MCSSLKAQIVIGFEYFLLSQSEIAFGNCNAAVIEEFHQHEGYSYGNLYWDELEELYMIAEDVNFQQFA